MFDVGSSSYVAVAVNFVNGVFLVDITDIHTPKPIVLMRDVIMDLKDSLEP